MTQVATRGIKLHGPGLGQRLQCVPRSLKLYRDARLVAKAIRSGEEVDAEKAFNDKATSATGAENCEPNGVYPKFERNGSVMEEGLFPLREPGNFPDVSVNDGEPKSFLSSIRVDFSETASLDEKAFDPLRDGPLRFLGYSNEVGEAFAAWLPAGGVPFSYAVAISYVLVDTYDKYIKANRRAKLQLVDATDLDASVDKHRLVQLLSAERALDTVIWQLIASVAAPGYTIHTIVALTFAALTSLEALDGVQAALQGTATSAGLPLETLVQYVNKSVPTGVGLAAIPFIVHPIDNGVHWIMNKTLRPAMRAYVCNNGGALAGLKMCSDECVVEEETKH